MSTTDPPDLTATPGEPAPEAPPGLLQRIIGIIIAPTKTFAAMRDNPRWLWIFLITALIVAVNFWLVFPVAMAEQEALGKTQQGMQNLSEEQLETMLKVMRWAGGPVAGLFVAVVLFLSAGIFHIGQKVLGGTGSYKASLSATTHGSFIAAGLGSLAKLPLILQKQSVLGVSFSPAAFVDAPVLSSTYRALAMLDVFALWGMVITGLGLAILCRVGKGLGIALSAVVFALFALIGFLMQGLQMGG